MKYDEFRKTRRWKVIEKALDDPRRNKDIEITTAPHYVIGYLCKALSLSRRKKTPGR